MQFDSDLADISGTYIFHNETDVEYNHILQLRKDKSFYQNIRIASNDKNYNFVRMGKYEVKGDKLTMFVEKHFKNQQDDPSIDTTGKTFTVKIDFSTGDLIGVPEDDKTRTFFKILTILEPKDEYTLGDFFHDVMKRFKLEHPFLYVKGNSKLYNNSSNLDLLLKRLLKPDELTLCAGLSILESSPSELKSRRTLNILITSPQEPEKEVPEKNQEEMPDDHDELMKMGGMCPVIHGDHDSEDGTVLSGGCPAECKQQ